MLERLRHRWTVVTLVGACIGLGAYGLGVYVWMALRSASALGADYSTVMSDREPLYVDAYGVVSGSLLLRGIAHRLVAAQGTNRERLRALMDWAHENVRPAYAAPARVVTDTLFGIVRRGYGFCDQTNHVFAALAHYAGYDAHLLFLRDAHGFSTHTVAEVRVDGRWVVVDAYLGTLFLDRNGRLASVADLGTTAALPPVYSYLGVPVDLNLFRRGTPFETFPFQGPVGLASRVWTRLIGRSGDDWSSAPSALASQGAADRPETGPSGTKPPEGSPPGATPPAATAPGATPPDAQVAEVKRPPTWDLQDEVLVMDEARRDHLEGRYDEAIEGYRELLARPLPLDMAESVRFFLGLALLRAGAPDQAIAAFDAALTAAPRTEWAPSVRYYRAEAKLRTSDLEGALADLRAADIAPARLELTRLARSRSVASGVDSRALR
jgi:hypothetical protein